MVTSKRALVTGVAGFIGSHVADECLRLGFEVVGFDDLSGGFPENVPSEARLVRGSVSDAAAVAALWDTEGPFDYVYHLAAYAAEGLSHFIRGFNYLNNVVGSVNIINGAIKSGAERVVFASSIAVYGAGQVPLTESTTPEPQDPYGIAKYAVELDLRAAADYFGLKYTVFRPHNVYGERQNIADPYRNVIGIFMNRLLLDQPLPVFGDGSQTRAFTHVNDVAPTIAMCVNNDASVNETFNIGADTPVSVRSLAELVARKMGRQCRIEYLAERNEVRHAFSDHSKLSRVFGAPSAVSLEDGLEMMVTWVENTGPQVPTPFQDLELTQGLPPSWGSLR